jgi:hypothetical protein
VRFEILAAFIFLASALNQWQTGGKHKSFGGLLFANSIPLSKTGRLNFVVNNEMTA